MSKENLASVENYNTANGKSLKQITTSTLTTQKADINSCVKCGNMNNITHNYCNNCGAVKEEISTKKSMIPKGIPTKSINTEGISNIITTSPSQLDFVYILKGLGIISITGLVLGIILSSLAFGDMIEYVNGWGLFSDSTIGKTYLSLGLFFWRFVSFIPLDYGFGQLYIFDTLEFISENNSDINFGLMIIFSYSLLLLYMMFVFGKKIARKYDSNNIVRAVIFSVLYSLILCFTVKRIFMQAFITVGLVSFVLVFLGMKYVEMKNKKSMEGI